MKKIILLVFLLLTLGGICFARIVNREPVPVPVSDETSELAVARINEILCLARQRNWKSLTQAWVETPSREDAQRFLSLTGSDPLGKFELQSISYSFDNAAHLQILGCFPSGQMGEIIMENRDNRLAIVQINPF